MKRAMMVVVGLAATVSVYVLLGRAGGGGGGVFALGSGDCSSIEPPQFLFHYPNNHYQDGDGDGKVVDDFASTGLKAYVSGSPSSPSAVLLVTDIYGYQAPHLRLIADQIASAGGGHYYYAVAPDFYNGDPYNPNKHSNYTTWLQAHPTSKGYEDARNVVSALRGPMAFSKIGASGFCWGGKVVTDLTKTSHLNITAAVLLHPAYISVDDMKEVMSPLAILGGELDTLSPPKFLNKCEQVLSSRDEIPSYLKIFPGVGHGWTLRYKDDDAVAVKKSEEARADMLAWFAKYIHISNPASN